MPKGPYGVSTSRFEKLLSGPKTIPGICRNLEEQKVDRPGSGPPVIGELVPRVNEHHSHGCMVQHLLSMQLGTPFRMRCCHRQGAVFQSAVSVLLARKCFLAFFR